MPKEDNEQQTETECPAQHQQRMDMNPGKRIQQAWQVVWHKFCKVLRNIHQKGVQHSINTKLVLTTLQEVLCVHWIQIPEGICNLQQVTQQVKRTMLI